MKKAIFLDKDGTLIYDVPYNVDPKKIRFTEGAIPGIQRLSEAGYLLFIISNQKGISLGYFTKKDLLGVQQKIEELFSEHKLHLSGFYFCPHNENDGCLCRKPKPGLILQAAKEHNVDVKKSWMIGDIPADIHAGKSAGCRTILFDKGYENYWDFRREEMPDATVTSLSQASDFILRDTSLEINNIFDKTVPNQQ